MKPKPFYFSIITKTTLISHSIPQVWKRKSLNKLKNNLKTIFCKLLKKSTKKSFKSTSIQLNLTTPMSEEFILDLNKLVRTSSLIMSIKEKNYANSTEISIESVSTSMSIPKL